MKKIISLAVLFLMLVGLFGCAAEAPAEPQDDRIMLDSSNFLDYLDWYFRNEGDRGAVDWRGDQTYFNYFAGVKFVSKSDRLTFHDVSITMTIDGYCEDKDKNIVEGTGTVTIPIDLFGNGEGYAEIYDHLCYLDNADISGINIESISGYVLLD